ncbi:peptidase [Bacillus phage Bolokhovo]|uniref:Peptidase n=1 Tax=Bacillus phage Bolokhovo TaxID=2743970 RepID=A0A7D7KGJ2_9CAUD|nr:peptidase [Bacillus phage Bolokhovo]
MTFLEEVDGRSITVRNIDYTIEVLSGEEIDDITGEKVFGVASDEDSKIYLRAGMNDDRAKQVFLHELLHVMFYESGYTFEDPDQEETIVEALSLVMRDMNRLGNLVVHLDNSENEFLTELDEAVSCELNGEELYTKPEPLFKLPKLFKAPLLFCNNEEFDPNKHYKKPNMNFEDKSTVDYYLVETKTRTHKISEFAYEKITPYMDDPDTTIVDVFDYIDECLVDIKTSEITELYKLQPVPLKEEN